MSILDNAEKSIVANALEDSKYFDEGGLRKEHFFDPRLGEIWKAIGETIAADQEVNALSVGDILEKRKALNRVGGLPALTELIISNRDYAPATTSANIIREHWTLRELERLVGDVKRFKHSGYDSSEIIHEVSNRLLTLENDTSRQLPTLKESYDKECLQIQTDIQRINNGEQLFFGLPTGLGVERIVPGGLPIGKVVALYGESGNFKTTTKNNLLWGVAACGGGSVIDFSFEDDNELTTQRFIGCQTGISYGDLSVRQINAHQLDELKRKDTQAIDFASNVFLAGDVPPNIDEVIRLSRHYRQRHGVTGVFLDYMQIIAGEKEGLDNAMRKIVQSAKRDQICYVVVSQVKQDVDFRASKGEDARPRITDMLGSSSFRMFPKLAIGVYRPYRYHKWPENKKRQPINYTRLVTEHPEGEQVYKEIIELWIQKNVLGEPEVCLPLRVNLETGKMVELEPQFKEYLE